MNEAWEMKKSLNFEKERWTIGVEEQKRKLEVLVEEK